MWGEWCCGALVCSCVSSFFLILFPVHCGAYTSDCSCLYLHVRTCIILLGKARLPNGRIYMYMHYMYMYIHTFVDNHLYRAPQCTWERIRKKKRHTQTHTSIYVHVHVYSIHVGPFFSRETIFADFKDFGTILEDKNRELHGGYGQWPSEIGNLSNLNP